jgi:catechol 2,3-dioxygenase-like lactoylglutathione lyase family enzyme
MPADAGPATRGGARVTRLLRVGLTVANLAAAERFYREAFGFSRVAGCTIGDPAWRRLMGAGVAAVRTVVMRLGAQELELTAFDPPGRGYPRGRSADDPWFQHVAIVVSDMAAAWAHLRSVPIIPVTRGGPQHLPPNTGAVTAVKFRDPEGHPLELIAFPPGVGDPAWQRPSGGAVFLGIDHSAIVVRDVARSARFYTERLGFAEMSHSINHGVAQRRLDATGDERVEVVALRPAAGATPHVELLGYRPPADGGIGTGASVRDIAATRLVLEVEQLSAVVAALQAAGIAPEPPGTVVLNDAGRGALVRDPDGHFLLLIQPP